MKTENLKINVSESIGSVTAEFIIPSQVRAVVTLAHGAGADMNHRFMKALANELAGRDIGTLRFNFPYMEKKKKMPDVPAVAEKTIATALTSANARFTDMPIFASGKSFGGRMSSQYASKQSPEFLKGLIFYGFPLHAPGKASTDRAAHLKDVKVPMLFLQGTRDTLAQWDLINEVAKSLPLASIEKFEGADHSFKSGKKEFIPELAEMTSAWIAKQLTK